MSLKNVIKNLIVGVVEVVEVIEVIEVIEVVEVIEVLQQTAKFWEKLWIWYGGASLKWGSSYLFITNSLYIYNSCNAFSLSLSTIYTTEKSYVTMPALIQVRLGNI